MSAGLPFPDRVQAGRVLGEALRSQLTPPDDALILGLVRGGAVIAAQAAQSANLAWDILIVRKIGAPHQPEYALGAYVESGGHLLNEDVIRGMGLSQQWSDEALRRAARECAALHEELRAGAPPPELAGRFVILTDDGMATGLTMLAAIAAVQHAGASETCAAVPVLAREGPALLREAGVRCAYLAIPPDFRAVGQYYTNFQPVSSSEVRALLAARGQ
jgi:putative phosphoribosyl transferase